MIDRARPKRREFEEEALAHLDALYRFARGFTGDPSQAEDWVQETLLKAYRSWYSYQRGTNIRAWLFTILRNTAYSHHRHNRRRQPLDFDDVESYSIFEELTETDPEGRLFAELVSVDVIDALCRLPLKFREAVLLTDVEDLSYAEVAEVTGVPIGTVKSRIARGRRLLQRQLYRYAVEMGYVSRRLSSRVPAS
ncbi:MAG: sigma-70 family RNA polymerase sigma factor [Gemmatimonadetes bacterium]|uniref:Sigma-70 family RNA polymerase sigma factor n=1 Tax=Candidatus Kutchimonas denitrificans TaxID=3056748 RepID=A0AAE4Z5R3_9BACT|nr:sigma-70 family RNA polymerase sigma factor [Gemmatimonadota bacterium]NIR73513.1 sigma-70 family RNA polymerase sigma factor [Candidatus Kutchimonas denitrificans]NIR99472.1 sigma-70 family RNA polymerase sigma factor [Gemmatimonadota bacterium]NIT65092.1 sigma-70 family RNA polymerase sigma factor [Gemmatimonadota bacterium]NIV23625.1 sigma-70 family RNA polymerase sigma factor [Gemmatimonadota bacterium]